MKRNFFKIALAGVVMVLGFSACTKDLDRLPQNEITSEQVYSTPQGYKQAFAKVYGAFALTGNQGPAGNADIQGSDEGYSEFLRLYWKAQVLSTDEAVIGWGDAGLPDFHNMNWGPNNPFLTALYYRCFYQITLANDFIRQASDANLSSRGISGADAEQIRNFRNEARFLRAYQYSVLMDLFGNVPFSTDADAIGSVLPQQIKRADLFTWVESELKALETALPEARANEYGRADRAAAWALLARIYLNAEVFAGTARYTDAITYSKKVIDAGYKLIPNYRHLMLADNHLNRDEFILTINYDGLNTQTWGGTTFLVHGAVATNMNATEYGVPGGAWNGMRVTKNLVNLFPDPDGNGDKRAWFQKNKLEIDDIGNPGEGYGVKRFRNVTRTGAIAPNIDPAGNFVSVDFPIFRLAEQYLIYAEAVLRGGQGGSQAQALQYVNLLRARAEAAPASGITTDYILDERARELYWEGFRRTDLVRYNRFTTGTYLWPWKGGVKDGRAVEAYRNLYPLPSSDVTANPNLDQNQGY